MNKKVFLILKIALFLALFPLVERFCLKRTDRFSILGIQSDRPFDEAWETRPLTDEERSVVSEAISQPYTYFGCGGQSFVFFSADQKYALKFFKQRVFKVPLWVAHFPIPWVLDRYRAKKTWQRADKLQRDFSSYKIAFEELPDETGMVFVHLNQTDNLKTILKITDKLGIAHELDLDKMDFVIQKKGVLAHDKITGHMQRGEIEEAKASIKQLMSLIVNRSKKGFHDRDPNIRTNCGFMGDRAVKIDVGRFVKDEKIKRPEVYLSELVRITGPLRVWLEQEHPALVSYFDEEILKFTSGHENLP
jgi:hypothetical protein